MPSVLITGFNRPNLLQKTIESILRCEGLTNLYIHIDGPRKSYSDDFLQVSDCHKLVVELAKEMKVYYFFQENNLGCEKGMKFAIDWFFSQEKLGVIIEDDILVHPQALQIAELALSKYQHIQKVGQINLYNPTAATSNNKKLSSHFVDYPMIWGWASWKDRWELNSGHLPKKLELALQDLEMKNKIGFLATKYWFKKFNRFTQESNTWDIPWVFTCWSQRLICLTFSHSLTTNIGDGLNATHTKKLSDLRLAPFSTEKFDLARVQFTDKIVSKKKANKKISNKIWDMSTYKIVTSKLKRIIKNQIIKRKPRNYGL
jgi:glycosyltransferase involved in cell wall biosynthesis